MSLITKLFNRNNLPNSLLLIGRDKEHKLKSALEFIKVYYGDSAICGKIDRKSFLDLKLIDKGEELIKIDEIREIINFVHLSPLESDKKFIIICNADRMNINAANSLLKILEEPPDDTCIILIADNSQLLLDTVVSRCLIVDFSKENKLLELCTAEDYILLKTNIKKEESSSFKDEYKTFIQLLLNAKQSDVISYINKITFKTAHQQWSNFTQIYLYLLSSVVTPNIEQKDKIEQDLMYRLNDIDFSALYLYASKLISDEKKLNLDRKIVALTLINKLLAKQYA